MKIFGSIKIFRELQKKEEEADPKALHAIKDASEEDAKVENDADYIEGEG